MLVRSIVSISILLLMGFWFGMVFLTPTVQTTPAQVVQIAPKEVVAAAKSVSQPKKELGFWERVNRGLQSWIAKNKPARVAEAKPVQKAEPLRPAGYIPQAVVQERVQEFFAHAPVMARVARCESGLRHTNKDGTVLRGGMTPNDVGVFQINMTAHKPVLQQLDLNPHVLEHNLAFASFLKQRDGLRPWIMSAYCWDPQEKHIAWKKACAEIPTCRDLAEKRGVVLPPAPASPTSRSVLTAQLTH